MINLADRPFFRTDATGEIAEVIGRKRNVRVHRLADRLTVVAGLDVSEQLEIVFDPIGDGVEHFRTLGRRGAGPFVFRRVRGVERGLDVRGVRTGHFAKRAAVDRALVGKVAPFRRRLPRAANKIVVPCAKSA